MSITIELTRNTEAHPVSAVLFYRSGDGAMFATEHQIINGEIMPGRAIDTAKLARNLARASAGGSRQWVHERTLIQEPNLLVWWKKRDLHQLVFTKEGTRGVYLPHLLFIVSKGQMIVWAYDGRHADRPGEATPLYHPPIMNRYEEGNLCMGDMPKGDSVPSWEESFFRSRFTNPHFHPKKYDKLWFVGTTAVKELVPAGFTVGQFLAKL